MNGENKDKVVVPWDFDKCFLQYNASLQDTKDKEDLFDCWKNKAKLTLNKTFCDRVYPLEKELGNFDMIENLLTRAS